MADCSEHRQCNAFQCACQDVCVIWVNDEVDEDRRGMTLSQADTFALWMLSSNYF